MDHQTSKSASSSSFTVQLKIAQGATVSSDAIGALSSLQTLSLIQVNHNHQVLLQDLANLLELRKLGLVNLDDDSGTSSKVRSTSALERAFTELAKLDLLAFKFS